MSSAPIRPSRPNGSASSLTESTTRTPSPTQNKSGSCSTATTSRTPRTCCGLAAWNPAKEWGPGGRDGPGGQKGLTNSAGPGWLSRLAERGSHLIGRPGGTGPSLRQLGRVPEHELQALYAAATVFAFPSLHEGFGLPVLEAMSAGVPVVASDIPAIREVAGDAAVLAPPGDVGAWAEALSEVLGSPSLQAELAGAGRRRAAAFSWPGRPGRPSAFTKNWRRNPLTARPAPLGYPVSPIEPTAPHRRSRPVLRGVKPVLR